MNELMKILGQAGLAHQRPQRLGRGLRRGRDTGRHLLLQQG